MLWVTTHPGGVDALLQTNGKVQFDKTVIRQSKPLFSAFRPPILIECRPLIADCLFFKDLNPAHTLRRWQTLASFMGRIKCEIVHVSESEGPPVCPLMTARLSTNGSD